MRLWLCLISASWDFDTHDRFMRPRLCLMVIHHPPRLCLPTPPDETSFFTTIFWVLKFCNRGPGHCLKFVILFFVSNLRQSQKWDSLSLVFSIYSIYCTFVQQPSIKIARFQKRFFFFWEENPELFHVLDTFFKSQRFAHVDMCSVRCSAKKCKLQITLRRVDVRPNLFQSETNYF